MKIFYPQLSEFHYRKALTPSGKRAIPGKFARFAILTSLMIFISIISISYIGDGLRDAFKPYKVLGRLGEYT